MLKKILTLLLALVMCSAALFGCATGDTEETSDGNTVSTDGSSDGGEIGDYDFGGADFTILARTETNYEHIGSLGSDAVSQKVYERNEAVMSQFKVNLKVVEVEGSWDKRDSITTADRKSVV